MLLPPVCNRQEGPGAKRQGGTFFPFFRGWLNTKLAKFAKIQSPNPVLEQELAEAAESCRFSAASAASCDESEGGFLLRL